MVYHNGVQSQGEAEGLTGRGGEMHLEACGVFRGSISNSHAGGKLEAEPNSLQESVAKAELWSSEAPAG